MSGRALVGIGNASEGNYVVCERLGPILGGVMFGTTGEILIG